MEPDEKKSVHRKEMLQNIRKKLFGLLKRWCGLVLLFFTGLIVLMNVIYSGYSTEVTWKYGILINVCFGICNVYILRRLTERIYRSWLPDYGDFFRDWKDNWKKQQKVIGMIAGILFIFAAWFFSLVKRGYPYGFYYGNYATGYLMFATVILQALVAEVVLIHFMFGRLQLLMEHMQEINQIWLAEALEIERQSLEKVSKSDQLRVDLITNVSHDLKTPLTSMVGYIELMKKEELTDTARDYLEVISKRAGRLKEMIESLFNLAKASSGNIELHKEKINLNRLLGQLMADMADKIQGSGLLYVQMLTKEDTTLVTDNTYMYRICQNLIENTLKYSAKGTRVFVQTSVVEGGTAGIEEAGGEKRSKERKICIEITNTAGYPMDFTKEDIVERFARADQARTTEGNGLGLAIVSTYAAALGGEFDILIDCDQFKAKLLF